MTQHLLNKLDIVNLVAVSRKSSIYTDWNKVLKEESIEIPKELAQNGNSTSETATTPTAPTSKKKPKRK